jgi:hypothetical protein
MPCCSVQQIYGCSRSPHAIKNQWTEADVKTLEQTQCDGHKKKFSRRSRRRRRPYRVLEVGRYLRTGNIPVIIIFSSALRLTVHLGSNY